MSLNDRKEAYKQIHIKAKAMGLCEDAYRNTLKALTGFSSCTELRPDELKSVLDFFNSTELGTDKKHHPDCFCDSCAAEVLL